MRFAEGMGIERFEAGDGKRAGACYEIFRATRLADDPDVPLMPPLVFEGWLRSGWIGDPRETWLIEDGDGIGGWYLLELPARDNPHLAYLDMAVRPERQRHGLGTALLRHAAGRALADGRRLLSGYALAGSPGEAFAQASGVSWGQQEIRRAMDTGALPASRLAELRDGAEAASAGYSLVSWGDAAPEEYVDQVAAVNRMLYDAPHEASLEEPVWDAARVRATEQRMRLQGMRGYTVLARHDASGELGGMTQVELNSEHPDWAIQALTAVTREHRGHRLGLRLKVGMLDLLADREPLVKHILTSNAAANEHMIGINEMLGYRPVGPVVQSWELPADQVPQS